MTDAYSGQPQATDRATLEQHFGTHDVLPLWIAEPAIGLLPELVSTLVERAQQGWFGYETRPDEVVEAFWRWSSARHGWHAEDVSTLVSPSVGTSIGVAIDALTERGDGVIIQPPVFTDFKPLIVDAGRVALRNPLRFAGGRYRIDLDHLADLAAVPDNRLLVLCSPHNPVGRVWTDDELRSVASVCAEHDVFVVADEIHADLALHPHRFVPFGSIAEASGVRWAALHGPIKTFGLAGVCDTLVVTADERFVDQFMARSSQLHLKRNNVFGLAAFDVAYRFGDAWLDGLLETVQRNRDALRVGLPSGVDLVEPEGTYLAWLDFRALDVPVPELGPWLARSARVAVSPGHWFGREGAGFARMTIAAEPATVDLAIEGIANAVASR